MSTPESGRPSSLVATLAAGLRQRISDGAVRPGARMPSVRQLARTHRVSPFTAAQIYNVLVAEGLIDARRGAGYFVAVQPTARKPQTPPPPEPLADSLWRLRAGIDPRQVIVDAGCGWLPAQWMFAEGVRTALVRASKRPVTYAARYGSAHGLPALRRHLAGYLAHRAIPCDEDQIVLTQGASQALLLAVRLLAQPGDTVLVDDPCYPYLLDMFRNHGVQAIGVPRTAAGPDLEVLARLAAEKKPRAFFTNTTLHNPTGTTTSAAAGHRVLAIADKHDFLIVEDDLFAELAAVPSSSLAALDELKRVVYIGSFSKVIAPNLRVGYSVVPRALVPAMLEAKMVATLSTSELTEQLVLSILTAGRHRTHLDKLRRRLMSAQDIVTRRLTAAGAQIDFQPASGMFLWARLSRTIDSATIMQKATAQGILLAPGELFHPDRRSTGHFRFNVAHADEERLFRFIETLADR